MQQEIDSEVPEEEAKVEALVDLSELKELLILDIADVVPPEVLKSTSGQVLPSEVTRGSSILDNLETPLTELIEGDSMKKGRGQKVKGSSRTTEVHSRRRRRTSANGRPPKEDREVPPGTPHSEAGTRLRFPNRQHRSLLQASRNRSLARY